MADTMRKSTQFTTTVNYHCGDKLVHANASKPSLLGSKNKIAEQRPMLLTIIPPRKGDTTMETSYAAPEIYEAVVCLKPYLS